MKKRVLRIIARFNVWYRMKYDWNRPLRLKIIEYSMYKLPNPFENIIIIEKK